MWDLVQPCLKEAGITRVADITGLDWVGLPVWTAIRPNAYCLSVSQGKGLTPLEAKLGAVMEALESYVAERPQLATCQASHNDMAASGELFLNPEELPRLESSLYSADRPFSWARGEDLFSGRDCWAPTQIVDLDFRKNNREIPLFLKSSSGLASGGDYPEALYHALTELIERDAWTIFTDRRGIINWEDLQCDLTAIRDGELAALLDKLWAADLEPVLLDITLDINLPVMACLLFENDNCHRTLSQHSCFLGSGCSHNPYAAATQAIIEAVQGRLTLIGGTRDDITRTKYESTYTSYIWENLYRRFIPRGKGGRDLASYRQLGRDTLGGDIEYALSQLKAANIGQLAFFDLSNDNFPFKVVRLVAPKLEIAFHVGGITRGSRSAKFGGRYA